VGVKEQVIKSCRYLLLPVVRFVLRHGVTISEFAELTKEAYVQVARQDHGIDGRPTNNARVALLTGLSRREVAKIRDRLLDGGLLVEDKQGNRISQVLTGWHVDSEFADADGQPKVLPASGPTGSMSSLLKRYAGDLPHTAIRKEMLQRSLIEERPDGNYRVLKRDYVYSELDPEIITRMGVALHDHASTLAHNLDEKRRSAPRFEAIADNAHIKPSTYKAFHKLVEERGLSFLEEIDGWLSENEIDTSTDSNARTVRLGVGVYLIHDESKQGPVS
jgi:DNA-binding transcriptional ArsR family regulator